MPQTGAKYVVGIKQLRRAIQNGICRKAFLARDADPALTEPIAALCREAGIELAEAESMAALGKQFGISVGAAAAGLLQS